MIRNSRESGSGPKQEGGTGDIKSSSSRQWSRFRNPRIVPVPRFFGGKDRHSKVCTIRGLRDRRIRLSVPAAVELYSLQDRLGVGQPSKVIDWLLDAAKEDIDKLPPLPFPLGFDEFHHQMRLDGQESQNSAFHFHGDQAKELVERESNVVEKGKWVLTNNDTAKDNPSSSFHYNNPAAIAFNPYYHINPWDLSSSRSGYHNLLFLPENVSPNTSSKIPNLFFCPSTPPSFSPAYHHSMNIANPGLVDTQRNDENHHLENYGMFSRCKGDP